MRIIKCQKCGKDGPHLMLTHNNGGYQYQYEECKSCGHQVFLRKTELPAGFDPVKRQTVFRMKGWDGGKK